jgi:hypothetical protein
LQGTEEGWRERRRRSPVNHLLRALAYRKSKAVYMGGLVAPHPPLAPPAAGGRRARRARDERIKPNAALHFFPCVSCFMVI